jgi:hypothetical protein
MRGDPQSEGRRVSTLKVLRLRSNLFADSDGSLMWLLSRFAADKRTDARAERIGRAPVRSRTTC